MTWTDVAFISGLVLSAGAITVLVVGEANARYRPRRTVSLEELLYPSPTKDQTSQVWDGSARRMWAGYEWDQFSDDPRSLIEK